MTYEKNNLVGSLTLFRTETDDLIGLLDSVSASGGSISQYVNIDKALVKGAEAGITFQTPTNNTKLSFSYTYLDSENRSAENRGNELAFRSKHSAKINASSGVSELGFKTMVQPAAKAGATLRVIIDIG